MGEELAAASERGAHQLHGRFPRSHWLTIGLGRRQKLGSSSPLPILAHSGRTSMMALAAIFKAVFVLLMGAGALADSLCGQRQVPFSTLDFSFGKWR